MKLFSKTQIMFLAGLFFVLTSKPVVRYHNKTGYKLFIFEGELQDECPIEKCTCILKKILKNNDTYDLKRDAFLVIVRLEMNSKVLGKSQEGAKCTYKWLMDLAKNSKDKLTCLKKEDVQREDLDENLYFNEGKIEEKIDPVTAFFLRERAADEMN